MIRFPASGSRLPETKLSFKLGLSWWLFLRRTLYSEEGSPEAGCREPEAGSEC